MSLKLNTASGGSITLQEADTASNLTLTVPATAGTILTTNSNLTGLTGVGNLTEVDIWRLTSTFTNSGNNSITSNLARASGNGASSVGTGMSESSGIFTFPSTGYWLISFVSNISTSNDIFYTGGLIYSTTDNSSYNAVADGYNNVVTAGAVKYANTTTFFLFNVTSTSLCKVKFNIDSNGSVTVRGNSGYNQTHMVFQKVSA
jgi:hypothetical protein